nr:cellulose synthase-like protein E1 [Arachis hypogaea]
MRQFLWKGQATGKGLPLVKWEVAITPKKAGGLGIRDTSCANIALLGKLVWDCLNNSKKLWVQVLKHKYLRNQSGMNGNSRNSSSATWKNIISAYEHLKEGLHWNIGDVHKSVWYDEWTPFEKFKFTMWLSLHDALPTETFRFKRHLASSDMCKRCNKAQETMEHCLRDCERSKAIWYMLDPSILDSTAGTALEEWFRKALANNEAYFGAGLWWILLHGKDSSAKDIDGIVLPTLVYLSREKRPHVAHNFKAGAMNSLIRVSSIISNGKIILNVDCDMYSNNAQSLKEALCFLIDEEKGHEIAFVQTPQGFENLTKNDIYGGALRVIYEWEFPGMDGFGGPMYIGSGCFHKRDTLCGRKFNDQESLKHWNGEDINNDQSITKTSLHLLEEKSKALLSCTYENNTLWGKEMGLLYGCAVEDVITGLAIQCRGWKSVYYNPKRKAFLGVSPTTLPEALVQHKRWSEGGFQILLSKYSAAWCAYGLISPGLQITYCFYNLWVLNCLPTLYYSIFPSLCLLKGISLFPQMSSPWFIPYAYVTLGENTQCLLEFLWSEGTIKGYWNDLRMWLYKRTSSYLFALIDTIFKSLGFSSLDFVISAKVAEENVSQRYKKEIMEFGNSSPMLTLLATLALFNLFCLVGALFKGGLGMLMVLPLQVLLSVVLVLINLPLYEGLFLRKDKGRFPTSVVFKSMAVALSACVLSNVNVFTII